MLTVRIAAARSPRRAHRGSQALGPLLQRARLSRVALFPPASLPRARVGPLRGLPRPQQLARAPAGPLDVLLARVLAHRHPSSLPPKHHQPPPPSVRGPPAARPDRRHEGADAGPRARGARRGGPGCAHIGSQCGECRGGRQGERGALEVLGQDDAGGGVWEQECKGEGTGQSRASVARSPPQPRHSFALLSRTSLKARRWPERPTPRGAHY